MKAFGTNLKEEVSHPGKFEGCHQMIPYLYLSCDTDESSGDVESAVGWFARIGKWIITEDTQGFVDGWKSGTIEQAKGDFRRLETEYYALEVDPF